MVRSYLEIYAEIVKNCPKPVHKMMRDINIAHARLKEAHKLGIIEMELKGHSVKPQPVKATNKGIKFYLLIKEAKKLIRAD